MLDVDMDISRDREAASKLQIAAPSLDSQDALDLAVLLDAVTHDPSTQEMVANLRSSGVGRLKAWEDSTIQAEMVVGLKKTPDELKALEYLIQDPARAFLEMIKDGMVDEKWIIFYRKNPEKLANDKRKGLYFSFVALAVATGFLYLQCRVEHYYSYNIYMVLCHSCIFSLFVVLWER